MVRALLVFGSRLRDAARVLFICRFSVITLLTGIGFLLVAPQGSEVLRALADGSPWSWIAFLAATLLWSAAIWYWSRTLLSIRYPDWPPQDDPADPQRRPYLRSLHQWMPRILGGLSSATVFVALLLAAVPLSHAHEALDRARQERFDLWILAACALVVTGTFQVFTIYRRRLFPSRFPDDAKQGAPLAASRSLVGLPRDTVVALLASIVFTLLCFIAFTTRTVNHQIAPVLGAATIVLLAAAAWVPAGSVLVHIGNRTRFPVLVVVGLLLVVFGFWNDNHLVRALPDRPKAAVMSGSVRSTFEDWVAKRAPADDVAPSAPLPYVVVIAEGGGIRAAYWTASVLTALHDRYPAFGRDLFVISGVSGGSLGAAVYAALLASDAQGTPLPCAPPTRQPRPLSSCARQMLAHDFLAPTLGTMLYPDLVQRFLPVAIPYFDRGVTLEESFENAWRQTTGSDRFAAPFADLWPATAGAPTPSLILNGTSVEQGRRLLTTNLPVLGEAMPPEFSDFDDVRRILEHDVRVSTAVNNSARFTYVSPGGRLKHGAHIVDGGYFENSGATSAGEVVAAIPRVVGGRSVVPVVIHIRNEPEPESGQADTPNNVASETLTPLVALLNTRGARGVYAVETLKSSVKARGGEFVTFALYDHGVPLPLGWALSSSAVQEMDYQLRARFECGDAISAQLRRYLGEPVVPCTAAATVAKR